MQPEPEPEPAPEPEPEKRPCESGERPASSEAAAKPPKPPGARAARRAKPAEPLLVPERSKREKKTPRPFVAEPAPPPAALRRYALEAPHLTPWDLPLPLPPHPTPTPTPTPNPRYALEASHLTPSEATDALCTSTVVGGQRVPMQGRGAEVS